MDLLRHLVLFPIRADVPDEQVDRAITTLRQLSQVDGVREMRVELSADTRKGRVIVENALIEAENFEAFRGSAAHRQAAGVLAEISEVWLVGDYVE